MKKSRAELDAEIDRALAAGIMPPKGRPLRDFAHDVEVQSKRRQKRLHQMLLAHHGLVVTDGGGKQTLLIRSGEMSNPEEGAHRVTEYLKDGPRGHMTRKTITRLAQDLSRDLAPVKIEAADDDRVMAWMTTPEYEAGVAHVLEMQRRNERR